MEDTMDAETTSRRSKTCSVCGFVSNTFHLSYGASACLSCRAFFRRIVNKGRAHWLGMTCRGLSGPPASCQLTVENRSKCNACRFTQCLRAGMKAEAVLDDVQKRVRFKKKFKENLTKTKKAELSPSSSASSKASRKKSSSRKKTSSPEVSYCDSELSSDPISAPSSVESAGRINNNIDGKKQVVARLKQQQPKREYFFDYAAQNETQYSYATSSLKQLLRARSQALDDEREDFFGRVRAEAMIKSTKRRMADQFYGASSQFDVDVDEPMEIPVAGGDVKTVVSWGGGPRNDFPLAMADADEMFTSCIRRKFDSALLKTPTTEEILREHLVYSHGVPYSKKTYSEPYKIMGEKVWHGLQVLDGFQDLSAEQRMAVHKRRWALGAAVYVVKMNSYTDPIEQLNFMLGSDLLRESMGWIRQVIDVSDLKLISIADVACAKDPLVPEHIMRYYGQLVADLFHLVKDDDHFCMLTLFAMLADSDEDDPDPVLASAKPALDRMRRQCETLFWHQMSRRYGPTAADSILAKLQSHMPHLAKITRVIHFSMALFDQMNEGVHVVTKQACAPSIGIAASAGIEL